MKGMGVCTISTSASTAKIHIGSARVVSTMKLTTLISFDNCYLIFLLYTSLQILEANGDTQTFAKGNTPLYRDYRKNEGPSNSDVDERLLKDCSACAVPALTNAGSVCGTVRQSYGGRRYASFRGVPYARQPLGELRFKAPQPTRPWRGYFNASTEGPICPQTDVFYGPMMQPNSMGEDCLRINLHVPESALPKHGLRCHGNGCLPILVYVHGGGMQLGSGDSDVNGPEYIVDQNVILVTFNYRLGVFGFLSLNTSSIPGNAGLRDIIAALKWVQTNARSFGGDPTRVTLMGESAGASLVHLLSLSDASRGLFRNVILMSGTSGSSFFTTTPSYAQYVLDAFLDNLNINTTDTDEIHSELMKLPFETLKDANTKILQTLGFNSFNPVVESKFYRVIRILEDDPDTLVERGKGSNYPLIVGYTSKECYSLQRRLEDVDIVAKIKENNTALLPIKLLFAISDDDQVVAAEKLEKRYNLETPTMEKYLVTCTEMYQYPSLKLAQTRAATGGAQAFLYQFSYGSDFVPAKQAFKLSYPEAGHLDDLSYVLRVNSILGKSRLNASDNSVKDWMINIVGNFVRCSAPSCSRPFREWPTIGTPLVYQNISKAAYSVTSLTAEQRDMMQFYDDLYKL